MKPASHIFLLLVLAALFCAITPYASSAYAQEAAAHEEVEEEPKEEPKEELENEYEDLPDEYINEAQAFYEQCLSNPEFNRYMDCRCLSVTYLDARIANGPELPASYLRSNLEHKCYDAAGAAGYYFDSCMSFSSPLEAQFPRETYCTCYANRVAELYEMGHFDTETGDATYVQDLASRYCGRAEKLSEIQREISR